MIEKISMYGKLEKSKINSFLSVVILLCSLFIIYIVYRNNWIFPPLDFKELMFLIVVLIFLPITYILIRYQFLDKNEIGFTIGNSIWRTIIIGIIAGLLPFILSFLLLPKPSITTDSLEIFRSSFLSPIWEEFLFRSLLFSSLYIFLVDILSGISSKKKQKKLNVIWIKKINLISAVFFTVAIFTVAHADYSWSILLGSSSFTISFYFNRSIITPIIAHSIYNILVSIFIII